MNTYTRTIYKLQYTIYEYMKIKLLILLQRTYEYRGIVCTTPTVFSKDITVYTRIMANWMIQINLY